MFSFIIITEKKEHDVQRMNINIGILFFTLLLLSGYLQFR